MRFVVLSSSRGTTFQAVIEAMERGELTAECLGLITDRADRECIAKAKAAGLPYRSIEQDPKADREVFDREVHRHILELAGGSKSDVLLVEMGWMWIHTPWFIAEWSGRILNVHPALLPKHGGKGMYGNRVHQAVLAAGDTETGITIHVMDEGVDTGPIVVQKKCSIEANDTVETVQHKVQNLEKEWYPKALQMIEAQEIVLP